MSGSVNTSKSEFDGSTHITENPGWAGGQGVKMGLSWNTKMPREILRIDVLVSGGGNIGEGKSLHFNIDGSIVDLVSYDEKNAVTVEPPFYSQVYSSPGAIWTGKSYEIPTGLIKKMTDAQRVVWRIDMGKDYREGALFDGPMTALSGFRDFLAEMNSPDLTAKQ